MAIVTHKHNIYCVIIEQIASLFRFEFIVNECVAGVCTR